MSSSMGIGVRFEPDWPPEELPEFARWAEGAGFDEVWFSEDVPWAGGIAMAATVLATTERIGVGIGCLPAVTRNVATLAMEIGALARMGPGRVTIALSHGVPEWMRQVGAEVPDRLRALEEITSALRGLLAGRELEIHDRHVDLDGFSLGFPPQQAPPIVLGTTGPRGLALAGRVSDGVVLAEVSSPEAVRWARDQMSAAGDTGTTIIFAMAAIADRRETALAEVRPRIQRLVDFGIFPHLLKFAGLDSGQETELTDQALSGMTAAGTPDDCLSAIQAWADAGADRVILVAGADDPKESYARFANEVLPRLRSDDADLASD